MPDVSVEEFTLIASPEIAKMEILTDEDGTTVFITSFGKRPIAVVIDDKVVYP